MLLATGAHAQDQGTLDPEAAAAAGKARRSRHPAKELFGRKTAPAPMAARSIGFYSKGCLAGAKALPINGKTWQVMRLSRNRNWGHPKLVQFLERLADKAPKIGWRGLLVGDMSQPRGGPMLTGHASHQVGLDADIWLTPMPDRELTRRGARGDVGRPWWSPTIARTSIPKSGRRRTSRVIKAAAEGPEGRAHLRQRRDQEGAVPRRRQRPRWLHKVRPWWGHDYHFHVRISCPADSPDCKAAGSGARRDEGCGKDLDYWFTDAILHPKPSPIRRSRSRRCRMADLPPACRQVLLAP